jgi:Autotransporter beta-domain
VLHKTLCRMLGCVLLSYGGTALAFTLIELPESSPSSTITDSSTTLQTQVQPIAATIRSQILGHLRPRGSKKATQFGGMMLAANAQAGSIGDFNNLLAAGAGVGDGGGGVSSGNSESLWISTAINNLENDFSRTPFYGVTQNLLVGFDLTRSNKYVAGVSLGYEASNFTTAFNAGNEKTRGFNINPYFAWLLSDTWSWDLILGYGDFETRQTRALGVGFPNAPLAVTSDFSSKRGLASSNLTNVSTFGNWKLTGSLGFLWSRKESDSYRESPAITGVVPESKQTLKQWSLLGEAAYGRGNSEAFFGATYESVQDMQKVVLTAGLGEQPANDPTSVLLTAGWRYFATKGLSANFLFSGRVSQNDFREQYGFSMVLRMDL